MTRLVGLFLAIGLFLGSSVAAQERDNPQFGFTLGVNLATLEAGAAETSPRPLFSGGLVAQMDVGGPVSVQSQLLFDQKGATVEAGDDAVRYGAGYVDLPILLRVEGPSLGSVTPYGLAGGFGGVKVSESQRAGSSGLSLDLEASTSFFRRTNAGLVGGAGGAVPVGAGRRLHLVVQYSYGLLDVARSIDEQPLAVPFPAEAQTRTWAIQLRLGL